jgi:TRAP-type mannitol/chloroaromatic compound transport system substrate-binding protein
VVKAFDLIEAVSKGVLDGGHGVNAYWYGKNSAIALWGSGPAFGMDANMVLAWHEHGGGKALLAEIYKNLNLDVVSFLYGPMPTQPLGWFKKPIVNLEDLKGLRYRAVGLSIELFTALGTVVKVVPSGEIVAAMDRGLLDAAEFNNASSDRAIGFPDVAKVCMLQSFHQCAEQFEIIFNRATFNALAPDLKSLLTVAVQAASADMSWKAINRYSQDYTELQKNGVKFIKTPDAILLAQLKAWDDIVAKKSAENPLFKRVLDSMEQFATRACRWANDTNVDYKMAFQHATNKKT